MMMKAETGGPREQDTGETSKRRRSRLEKDLQKQRRLNELDTNYCEMEAEQEAHDGLAEMRGGDQFDLGAIRGRNR